MSGPTWKSHGTPAYQIYRLYKVLVKIIACQSLAEGWMQGMNDGCQIISAYFIAIIKSITLLIS